MWWCLHSNRGNQDSLGGQNNSDKSKENCKYCKEPGLSVENCWKLQAKKAAMNPADYKNEYHEEENDQN
jgi:hypothetical protein